MFDWPRLLAARGVPYVTRGPNTAKNHLSVKCPFCGDADPSQHLGISLKGEGWGCLRNSQHRGRSRARLISALLHCSMEEAHRIAGTDQASPTAVDEDFGAEVAALLGMGEPTKPKSPLTLLPEFKRLGTGLRDAPFLDYLWRRGYNRSQIEWISDAYKLHRTVRGEFRYRLIIPVYSREGVLQTWTGRTIAEDESVRYKSLSKEKSVDVPSNLLLGLPLLWKCTNPHVLVLCEGPFDALRISALGREYGIYGTCLFGLNVSERQALLLDQLSQKFQRIILLLDPDADWAVLRIRDLLQPLRLVVGTLPTGVKDPGELSQAAAEPLLSKWLLAS